MQADMDLNTGAQSRHNDSSFMVFDLKENINFLINLSYLFQSEDIF